jgi:hypothetical protein
LPSKTFVATEPELLVHEINKETLHADHLFKVSHFPHHEYVSFQSRALLVAPGTKTASLAMVEQA